MNEIRAFADVHYNAVTDMLHALHNEIAKNSKRPANPSERPILQTPSEFSGITDLRGSGYQIQVALRETRPVGFIGFHVFRTNDPSEPTRAMISELYVMPSFRQMGFGKRLMKKAEDICRKFESSSISVNVHVDNTQAYRLYECLEFSTVSRLLQKKIR